MTNTEIQAVRRAITLLSQLIDEPQACAPVPYQSPVWRFVRDYLVPDPEADLASEELWTFFQEVTQAGDLPGMRKATFLRELPVAMQAAFGVKKSHHVEREGRRVRGFAGVGIRMDSDPGAAVQLEP